MRCLTVIITTVVIAVGLASATMVGIRQEETPPDNAKPLSGMIRSLKIKSLKRLAKLSTMTAHTTLNCLLQEAMSSISASTRFLTGKFIRFHGVIS